MQKLLGLIFILVGMFGTAIYAARSTFITKDEKIAMLLGLFMILVGIMIIYADRKKKTEGDDRRNSGD